MWSTERAGPAAGIILTLVLLGGCATPSPSAMKAAVAPRTPLDQYAPKIERTPERLALGLHAGGLSPRQQAALAEFVADWRANGGGEVITIESPVGGRPEADPGGAAAALGLTLGAMGVPASQLRIAGYEAANAPGAPLVLRYVRLVAHGEDCTQRWDNLVATNSNGPSRHFGCTAAANLAVEIADAHDLVAPAGPQPGDTLRRTQVLDKYRQGQATASAKDAQANGAVSTAVQ